MHTCGVKYSEEMVLNPDPETFEYCGAPAPYKWGLLWLCAEHWKQFGELDDTWEEGLMHSIIVPMHMKDLL